MWIDQNVNEMVLSSQVAEQEVGALNKDMEEVESIRKQLAEFFCEDPVSFKLEECFKVSLLSFVLFQISFFYEKRFLEHF